MSDGSCSVRSITRTVPAFARHCGRANSNWRSLSSRNWPSISSVYVSSQAANRSDLRRTSLRQHGRRFYPTLLRWRGVLRTQVEGEESGGDHDEQRGAQRKRPMHADEAATHADSDAREGAHAILAGAEEADHP